MFPIGQTNPILVGLLDTLFWPAIHLMVSWLAFKRPKSSFQMNNWFYRARSWEASLFLYKKILKVKVWKRHLPDGAHLFRGTFKKDKLYSKSISSLEQFEIETCRSEWAHWITMLCAPLCYFWNPPWAIAVMTVYGLLVNLPFITVQRYNRIILRRIVTLALLSKRVQKGP